jgi:hypothetical protein
MRIPIWPGIRLSIWEPQNPDAVNVTLAFNRQSPTVRRVLSMRGWMILLVRYDWRDTGQYATADSEQAAPVNWEATARQRERELRTVGEARHTAEQRISDAVDVIREWQRNGPSNDYLTRVHRALRPPVSGNFKAISDTASKEPTP